MIDFVTRRTEILVLRDNQPYFHFTKEDMINEHAFYLISQLNSEARKFEEEELNPTEEDEFFDLQNFVIDLAKKKI